MDLKSILDSYCCKERKAVLILILLYSHSLIKLCSNPDSKVYLERKDDFKEGLISSRLKLPQYIIDLINSDPLNWFCEALESLDESIL